MSDTTPSSKHTNRLVAESSPYLLQHAHNPVEWYPWGTEAFEAARSRKMPIFLSVGYSTCYWCHVMERQCFENETIAAEMNARFINIKVDREERPDVDQLYMTAVQVLTRHGGWPMSVFLTPDLRPFYGGTYFPPTDMHGRPGFVTILRGIEDAYKNRPGDVEKTASQLVNILGQYAAPAAVQASITVDDAFVEDLIERSISDYDAQHGGFGGAPKFPRETLLELLLVYLQKFATRLQPKTSKMIFHTLDALADGGIRDQLGGGFHRYSTDAHWLVPHFEIMLYDNAMLAWCYVEAFSQTGNARYAGVARDICDFVLREMTSPAGGFYTAIDAEVDGQEGLNYLWTAGEIESILGADDSTMFNAVYGVDRGPNFADPHHGTGIPDKNILFLPISLEQSATSLKMDAAALDARLAPMRKKLYDARVKRKQPILDTKSITSWNALMIRALAYAAKKLGEPRYTDAATKAADFILKTHRTSDGGLFRASRDGVAKYHGFLDDYAFFIQALLALFDATGDAKWREDATKLTKIMTENFGGNGFYFTEKDAPDLIIRQMTASDSPLPSGNAVAAMALMELGKISEVRTTLAEFAQQLKAGGEGMSSMVQAVLLYVRRHGTFSVASTSDAQADTRPLTPAQLSEQIVSAATRWLSPTEAVVRVTLMRGYHINASDVPKNLSLIATRLVVEDDAGATVEYPPGELLEASFADQPLRVYSGEFDLRVKLSKAPASGVTPVLSLTYQPCDDTGCLPPITKRI